MRKYTLLFILFTLGMQTFLLGQPSASDWDFTLFNNSDTVKCDNNTHFKIYSVTIYYKYRQGTNNLFDTIVKDEQATPIYVTNDYWGEKCQWRVAGSHIPSNQTVFIVKDNVDTMKILFPKEKVDVSTIISVSFQRGTYFINKIPQTVLDKNLIKAKDLYYTNLQKQNQIKDSLEKTRPKQLFIEKKETIPEKDSLISIYNNFYIKDTIVFIAKLSKDREVFTSCCGDNKDSTDFIYTVYSFQDNSWKQYFTTPQCDQAACLMTFLNGNKYSISPIKKKGRYYLTINGIGFIIISNQFIVKE